MYGICKEEPTGFIAFPCCAKCKKLLYGRPTGRVSDVCPRCGKKAMFDLDGKQSWLIGSVTFMSFKKE